MSAAYQKKYFNATRPAQLHDELKHFLSVYDPDAKYQKRGRRG